MSEDFYQKAREAGRNYWNAYNTYKKLEDEKDKFEEIRKTIQKLEAQLQKFREGSILRARIEEQIKHLKNYDREIEIARKRLEAAEKEILQLTADYFEIDPKGEQKLDKDYIMALNHLLLNEPKDKMEFDECVISSEGVISNSDELRVIVVCANICDFVRMAARRKLGEKTELRNLWERITRAKKMFKVFSILAVKGATMTAKEISAAIGDPGWNTTKVKNSLNDLLRDRLFTYKLIRRIERGRFKISDIGRFLWLEFGSKKKEVEKISPSAQSALNKWTT